MKNKKLIIFILALLLMILQNSNKIHSLQLKDEKYISYINTDDNLVIQSLNTGEVVKKLKLDSSFYENPLFSPKNDKIILKGKEHILIYDIKNDKSQKLKTGKFIYYKWLDYNKIIYINDNQPGYIIYDTEKDKIYEVSTNTNYKNIFVGKNLKIYSNSFDRHTLKDKGIEQIELSYNKSKDIYTIKSSKTLIEFGKHKIMRYSPEILDISPDKNKLYILETSSSFSEYKVGFGTYNLVTGKHKDFLNIQKWCDDIGKEEKSKENEIDSLYKETSYKYQGSLEPVPNVKGLNYMLPYIENIATNPVKNTEIAINQGYGFENNMYLDNDVVIYDETSKNPNTVKQISKDLVTQTPVFSANGKYIYYSGQKKLSENDLSYSNLSELVRKRHNIYRYDKSTGKTEQLTNKDAGDINPIPLSKDKVAFLRVKQERFVAEQEEIMQLILLSNGEEKILADNIRLFKYFDMYDDVGFTSKGYVSTRKMTDISNHIWFMETQ